MPFNYAHFIYIMLSYHYAIQLLSIMPVYSHVHVHVFWIVWTLFQALHWLQPQLHVHVHVHVAATHCPDNDEASAV